ncbi:MAG: ABC transporter ATP-binding protein [Planctomycetaceae bacterium]
MTEAAPAIDVCSLQFAYASGQTALTEVSFSVASGSRTAIVGPSGAGKSTLLMHLNGILPEPLPREESSAGIMLHGLALTRGSAPEIRRRVGFVFQDPDDQLFCSTVREDVAFGPLNLGLDRDDVLERVESSLQLVGLSGYEFRSTLQLSVGEKRRVCLAGVLACRPDVLALDEPFSNLDPRARQSLIGILREFPGSQVIATHDLDLVVELCDQVIVLDEGRIHATGAVREILSDAPLMERHGLEVPYQLRG